ncbi:hypothetical protein PybrP1_000713 [[Pythium] brassicae (nom. inval.)]|nr:hypothetical protein PybrP1_000713 [[Pythium] brassicae (nom. inval.)]
MAAPHAFVQAHRGDGVAVVVATDFVVSESATTSTSNAAASDLKFFKQISISADAAGELTALSALALDLPGQVFVTYASKASKEASTAQASSPTAHGALLGEIKVYASTEALATGGLGRQQASDEGAKIVMTSTASGKSAIMLTEIMPLTKNAVKKVIANGAGDVVISNNVLLTKKKTDYAVPSRRLTRAADSANASSSSGMVQQISDRLNSSMWLITASGDPSSVTALDIDVSGAAQLVLQRIDSDLLPEGAVGVVVGHTNTTRVSSSHSRSCAVGALDTLQVTVTDPSAYATVFLPPTITSVNVTGRVRSNNLNTTFSDDALIVSAVYVDAAGFDVQRSGALQASFKEIFARGYVNFGTTIGTFGDNDRPQDPCPTFQSL